MLFCHVSTTRYMLRSSGIAEDPVSVTHSSICTLAQLLQLLERTWMSLVHLCGLFFGVEILYADSTGY